MSSGRKRTRILLVDKHPALRCGLINSLAGEPNLEVCGEAANVPEALKKLKQTKPDLVITEIVLRDRHGIDLIQKIKARRKRAKILVFSMCDELLFAERVFRAGAAGYISKEESLETIRGAIYQVLRGGSYFSARMTSVLFPSIPGSVLAQKTPLQRLSNRELEILELIGSGLRWLEIADRLGVKPSTLRTHRDRMLRKLCLKNGAELNRRAVQWVLNRD